MIRRALCDVESGNEDSVTPLPVPGVTPRGALTGALNRLGSAQGDFIRLASRGIRHTSGKSLPSITDDLILCGAVINKEYVVQITATYYLHLIKHRRLATRWTNHHLSRGGLGGGLFRVGLRRKR